WTAAKTPTAAETGTLRLAFGDDRRGTVLGRTVTSAAFSEATAYSTADGGARAVLRGGRPGLDRRRRPGRPAVRLRRAGRVEPVGGDVRRAGGRRGRVAAAGRRGDR